VETLKLVLIFLEDENQLLAFIHRVAHTVFLHSIIIQKDEVQIDVLRNEETYDRDSYLECNRHDQELERRLIQVWVLDHQRYAYKDK
jgi:hypothetical protein